MLLLESAELFGVWGPVQGCQTAVLKTGKTRLEACQRAISEADKTRCLWPVWLLESAELFLVLGPFQGCQTAVSKTGKTRLEACQTAISKAIKPDACGPVWLAEALDFSGLWGRSTAVKREFRKLVKWRPALPVAQVAGGIAFWPGFEACQTAVSKRYNKWQSRKRVEQQPTFHTSGGPKRRPGLGIGRGRRIYWE